MKLLLSQGKVAHIDRADFPLVAGLTFYAIQKKKQWYARAFVGGVWIYLHHLIVGKPVPGFVVDHKSRDGLDNRRRNLRHISKGRNTQNADIRNDNTSGYKGVTLSKSGNRWRSQIKVDGRKIHLGYFDDPVDAHRAYVAAAGWRGVDV